jgi:hypothetical protein
VPQVDSEKVSWQRLHDWAKKQVAPGTERISLEQLRKVLRLQSCKMQQERSFGLLARVRKIACADES